MTHERLTFGCGFHPLDEAVFLAEVGATERLVNLVAHHSYAALEARLRRLDGELMRFSDERGAVRGRTAVLRSDNFAAW